MFGGQDDNAATPQGGGLGDNSSTDGLADSLNAAQDPTPPAAEPTQETPAEEPAPEPSEDPAPAPTAGTDPDDANEELFEIKQQALQQLTPIVGQLDQTPEEKFRTTMMLIQASDNQDLLKDAYEAASAIPDEKLKAQALLDVVNEINYFTQPKQ